MKIWFYSYVVRLYSKGRRTSIPIFWHFCFLDLMVRYAALDMFGTKPIANAHVGIFWKMFSLTPRSPDYSVQFAKNKGCWKAFGCHKGTFFRPLSQYSMVVTKRDSFLKVAWTGSREKIVVNNVQRLRMASTVSHYVAVVMTNVTMCVDAYVHYQVIFVSDCWRLILIYIDFIFSNLFWRMWDWKNRPALWSILSIPKLRKRVSAKLQLREESMWSS